MADVSARRSELDDQQAIMDLVGGDSASLEELYGPWSLFKLIENSFLSISALNVNLWVIYLNVNVHFICNCNLATLFLFVFYKN